MFGDALSHLAVRRPTETDHARVLAVLDRWWGGFGGDDGSRERALLLPRLFFQHFATTSFLGEHQDGTIGAFLIGFLSQSDTDTAYIHFVGVAPELRGQGVAAALYRAFFDTARTHGRRYVHCVTSPGNSGSRAFHAALGFTEKPSEDGSGEVHKDYDGPGLDRIVFVRELTDD